MFSKLGSNASECLLMIKKKKNDANEGSYLGNKNNKHTFIAIDHGPSPSIGIHVTPDPDLLSPQQNEVNS